MRDHFPAAQQDGASLRGPFADRVPLVVEVAAHFQQATRRVPALTLVAPGTGRNVDQPAAVDPDLAAGQLAAVAVVQGIAQFVALDLDLDIVALHRHLYAHCTGNIHACRVVYVAAGRRIGNDLAARGNRQRIRTEMDVATRDDLHPRLVPAIIVLGQIVEGCRARAGADRVLLCRFLDEAVALRIQHRGLAIVLDQHRRGGSIGKRDAAAGITGRSQKMHGAALRKRGAGHGHTGLLDAAPGQGHVTLAGAQQAGVAHAASRAASDEARRDFIAAGGGAGIGRRTHAAPDHETVTGSELHLALARLDMSCILHAVPGQQHVTTAARRTGRLMGRDAGALLHHHLAECIAERAAAGVGAVQAVVAELRIADPCCGCQQVTYIDLAVVAEHHAIAVGHEHRAIGVELPQDLAGPRTRVIDPVQHGPVRVLQEVQRGVTADVEGLPVQDRLVRGLLDRDLHPPVAALRLDRVARVEPATGQRVLVDAQAVLAEAIGNDEASLAARLPRLFLQALLQGNRLRCGAEIVDRLLQLLPCCILLLGRQLELDRHAVGHAATLCRAALGRAAVGEPARTECLLRLAGRGHHAAQGDRDGPRHRMIAAHRRGRMNSGRERVRHRNLINLVGRGCGDDRGGTRNACPATDRRFT